MLMQSETIGQQVFRRGYGAQYLEGEVNHCPGCGRTNWIIGRHSAECAFCSTALPLVEAVTRASSRPAFFTRNNMTRLAEAS